MRNSPTSLFGYAPRLSIGFVAGGLPNVATLTFLVLLNQNQMGMYVKSPIEATIWPLPMFVKRRYVCGSNGSNPLFF